MAKHILALDFPDTPNEGIFRIKDTSIYTPLLKVECPELQILPSGYGRPAVLNSITAGFDLVLNACTMGIMGPASCADTCPNLPDGVWHIRYDISPNDKVYVEYDIMRTTHATNRLNAMYCATADKPCNPDADTVYQLQQLDLIRDFLVASQVLVGEQHKIEDGVNMYRYAVNLIDKLSSRRGRCRI